VERITTTTPRGNPVTLWHREDTSDLSIIFGTFSPWGGPCEDEYGLAALHIDGLALDIGAHIGTIAIALLADNPECRVIAIEPLPENVEMIRRNLVENGYEDRCEVVWGAFGASEIAYDYQGDSGAVDNRYVGNLSMFSGAYDHSVATVPQVKLAKLIPHGADFAKIDCEGCEWAALREAAAKRIRHIIGEGHGGTAAYDWDARIIKLLGKTHDVRILKDGGGIGLFEAVLR
jgi:FkbM family methyltransferase